jgi:hypothetical protein
MPPPEGGILHSHRRENLKSYKVKVILRPTVSRPVFAGIRPPSETREQFFFLT